MGLRAVAWQRPNHPVQNPYPTPIFAGGLRPSLLAVLGAISAVGQRFSRFTLFRHPSTYRHSEAYWATVGKHASRAKANLNRPTVSRKTAA
jgi:hypothetical protein